MVVRWAKNKKPVTIYKYYDIYFIICISILAETIKHFFIKKS